MCSTLLLLLLWLPLKADPEREYHMLTAAEVQVDTAGCCGSCQQ